MAYAIFNGRSRILLSIVIVVTTILDIYQVLLPCLKNDIKPIQRPVGKTYVLKRSIKIPMHSRLANKEEKISIFSLAITANAEQSSCIRVKALKPFVDG